MPWLDNLGRSNLDVAYAELILPGACAVPYIESIQYCSIKAGENWIRYVPISVPMTVENTAKNSLLE